MTDNTERPNPFEQAWLRGMTRRRMSRRELLRHAGVGAGSLSLAAFLAACSVKGAKKTGEAGPKVLPPQAGEVDVANWPLYIDKTGKTAGGDIISSTLSDFEKATGIKINYKEDINDNDEFFGTDIRTQLANGQPSGWDIIIMTDWMIDKLIQLGFLQELHQDKLPNATANLDEKFRDPWFDRGNAHSYPWAAGLTGIGYDPSRTGREITSIEDLFDPAFDGHIGMFAEMRDTMNFMFYLDGVDPVQATFEQAQAAQKRLLEQRPLVRGYYGNDYADQLAQGNLWVTMAWSGDVFTLARDNPNLKWILPEEGGNRWTDNMTIPLYAEHPTDAHEWINFVYDPKIATQITEWVWYESPVTGVQEAIAADGAEGHPTLEALAKDPFVWPDEQTLANTHSYKRLDAEEERRWQDLFQAVIQG